VVGLQISITSQDPSLLFLNMEQHDSELSNNRAELQYGSTSPELVQVCIISLWGWNGRWSQSAGMVVAVVADAVVVVAAVVVGGTVVGSSEVAAAVDVVVVVAATAVLAVSVSHTSTMGHSIPPPKNAQHSSPVSL